PRPPSGRVLVNEEKRKGRVSGANSPVEPDTSALAGFDVFYRSARDRVAVQIAAVTGDPAEALDHVQEAFIRAWARWPRVRLLDDPEGWVRRVAYNLAASRWRRARRVVLRGRPVERASPPVLAGDDEQSEVIAALATLARGPREAIVLHHLVGLR